VTSAVVRHGSPECGRGVPHSYLFRVFSNRKLYGIVPPVPTIAFTERKVHSLKPLPRPVESKKW
jgi:hypothetical protein